MSNMLITLRLGTMCHTSCLFWRLHSEQSIKATTLACFGYTCPDNLVLDYGELKLLDLIILLLKGSERSIMQHWNGENAEGGSWRRLLIISCNLQGLSWTAYWNW